MARSVLSVVSAALTLAAGVTASTYSLTSAPGGQFWGIGGISGGGATSRLLYSYPEKQKNEILDFLFKPNFGASLQVLKVEIGGGAQSTEGTEASHQYTADETPVFTRGYEWALMVDAKARNPAIKLAALPWVWPGFIDPRSPPGHKSPWNNISVAAQYVVDWLKGARNVYGLTIDYLGGWNERGYSSAYFKVLRQMLDAEGMASTLLVCGDDPHAFSCSKEVASNPSLRSLFVALGAHQPQAYDPVAASTGLPMWSTELHYNVANGQDFPQAMHGLYIDKNGTGFQSWALVSAYDAYLAFPDHGLFRAWWPTSGHYELIGRMWVAAHTTQFTSADGQWHYLANATGAAYLASGGSYVTLRNGRTGDWTLVVSKQASDGFRVAPEQATFTLDAALAGAAPTLKVWRSFIDPSRPDNDTSQYFLPQPDIPLGSGVTSFTLDLQVGDVYTVTTVATGNKGTFPEPPPPAAPFPTSWADDFSQCVVGQEGAFFVSQNGAFQCTPSSDGSGNVVMRQMAASWPIQWRPDEQRPHSVLGTALWRDTNASIRVLLPRGDETAMLGLHCFVDNTLPAAGPISSEMWLRGVWLSVDGKAGRWGLWPSYANATNGLNQVAGGALPGVVAPGSWHTVQLAVQSVGRVTTSASLDGVPLFSDVDASWSPRTGYVGIGTGDYGQFVEFDDVAVEASY